MTSIIASKIFSTSGPASVKINRWKDEGFDVVFTNGCFDMLHRGHIEILEKASSLGDYLIVGLNSDASVKRLKGPSRPVMGEQDRAYLLAALSMVDMVIIFEEDTPQQLIEAIVPDVLVKGGDYTLEQIVGADTVKDHGGKVEIIKLLDGFSTSKIIEKISK
jgi:D-beta-D-heptose 7-phosphate kinase/D-beta-D-heptose 1-phosphate adenosyltransferase